jgi:predicted PurR-regulated permease PerM
VLLAVVVVGVAALIAVIMQPRATFEAAGKNKTTWLILLAVGLVLFGPVGGLLGIFYLAAVRPKIRAGGHSALIR